MSGPGESEETGSSGSEETGSSGSVDGSTGTVVVNDCGEFMPGDTGHGGVPDPDEPALLDACEATCARGVEDADCAIADVNACIDACRLRTCGVCEGTMAAVVACELENWDALQCACESETIVCAHTDGPCADLQAATTQCGG